MGFNMFLVCLLVGYGRMRSLIIKRWKRGINIFDNALSSRRNPKQYSSFEL